jgi:hypothetical protein
MGLCENSRFRIQPLRFDLNIEDISESSSEGEYFSKPDLAINGRVGNRQASSYKSIGEVPKTEMSDDMDYSPAPQFNNDSFAAGPIFRIIQTIFRDDRQRALEFVSLNIKKFAHNSSR